MEKVLIIGASGFLGSELYRKFDNDHNYKVYGTYTKNKVNCFEYMDMSISESAENVICRIRPDIILIAASLTNVEYCERERRQAYKVNVSGIENIISICKKYECRVVYISTEYVFDGKNGPYSEEDTVMPINYYGETKLAAEKIIIENIKDYLIVRTTVVYGWDLNSKNFIMQLINNLSNNKPMKVPDDQVSSPTYCPNLADMIKESCNKKVSGIYNMVGNDIMDRYTFALEAAKVFDFNKELLIPVHTILLNQIAKRPLNAGLKIGKAIAELKTQPVGVIDGLQKTKYFYCKYIGK